MHVNIPFNWSVAAFPPRLNIASRNTNIGFQSAAVRPINAGHTGIQKTFAGHAEPNEPGARSRQRHNGRRQRKRRPSVSAYTSSTEGVAAWKRATHVVAPPPGSVYGFISRGDL